jgi:hypothetical protein
MLYRGPFVADFYRVLHHRVHHEYRARQAWQSLKSVLVQPGAWRTAHFRQAASIPLNLARLAKSSAKLKRLAQVPNEPAPLELQSA